MKRRVPLTGDIICIVLQKHPAPLIFVTAVHLPDVELVHGVRKCAKKLKEEERLAFVCSVVSVLFVTLLISVFITVLRC